MRKLRDLETVDFIGSYHGNPVAYFEIKCRFRKFEPYLIATQKLDRMCHLKGLPCVLVVAMFLGQRRELYRFDVTSESLSGLRIGTVHRTDRNDPLDAEPAYEIPFSKMERLI